MKGIFIIGDAFCEADLDKILNAFSGAAVMKLAKDETLELLARGQYSKIAEDAIAEFERISQGAGFVAVLGIGGFDEVLNVPLSKELSLPIAGFYQSELVAKISENFIASQGAVNLMSVMEGKLDVGTLKQALQSTKCKILTPIKFEYSLYAKARANVKTVVLPESDDERILRAAAIIKQSGAANLILLGREDEVQKSASKLGLDLAGVKILDPQTDVSLEKFALDLYELRKAKGMSEAQARDLVRDRTYFGTMLVYEGLADAMVSGAGTTTAETIRPALQIIKTKPGIASVSGAFIMCLDTQALLFADCAVAPSPSAEYLAGIAISSAATAKAFGLEPRVAMLSYSSGDSGSGDSVEFIKTATQKAREKAPELLIDGPLQFDAAVDAAVAKKKMPGSAVAGRANVFIFPDLNCGNICYKAVQRTAGAVAIGPILQGLKKPINDLSRGCSVSDVVNTILISAVQAGEN